ncbi:DUF3576 domain-containing protein [Halocynthiibacter sp.]|uniref:DUF3576 domain-containing protein n=1 Tax=Halocynthiibacter sp. TaxID=1979210 RepID=UPI003C3AAC8B
MTLSKSIGKLAIAVTLITLAACGDNRSARNDSYSGENRSQTPAIEQAKQELAGTSERETIWDLFNSGDDANVTLEVNKYIWRASLETLNFLPIQTADPFSGVISTGYGTPPGSSRSYRATIYITDPALDARSLNLSLQTRGGRAVDADTRRAVEDAILTRARQLRIAEGKL